VVKSGPRRGCGALGFDATDVVRWIRRGGEGRELATELGMMFMTHVADPDTWFATKYADASKYRPSRITTKVWRRCSTVSRRLGSRPHGRVAGGPEIPEQDAHAAPELYLDTSATKWVVRALGQQPSERVRSSLRGGKDGCSSGRTS